MPVTHQLNSKGFVKNLTNNDAPFSGNTPVIGSYYALSSASQTVINLPFSIQTTGPYTNTDAFWLFTGGSKLDLGSTLDYTFTSINGDGTSSQVTLTASLSVNTKIQAFKFGFKPEVQFTMDNRFINLYANQTAGFQGWVSQTDNLITATTTTGSPAAGTFYSSITGRASLPDLSQDLKVKIGPERLMVQQIQRIQTEFGPSGQPVYGTFNDTFGQIRFVGFWAGSINTNGSYIQSTVSTDYAEITFYGTGLNILTSTTSASETLQYAVDGGSASTFLTSTTLSNVQGGRNNAPNVIVNAVTGLTAGVHTVTITSAAATTNTIYGFEILTIAASPLNILVNPGIGYLSGQKLVSGSQTSVAYSTPVTGTKGGRVVVYQSAAGAIGQVFTACAASASYTTSASHTNEEVVRSYFWREFGAGRTDDFSLLSGARAAAFTLDDGVTTLSSASVSEAIINGYDALAPVTTDLIYFTFVGSGIDVEITTNAISDTIAVTVDNISATPTLNATGTFVYKIASGLAYGTHVLAFNQSAFTSGTIGFTKFIVYQPLTPSLPAGAMQIGSYNVAANYVANSTAGINTIGAGLIRNATLRGALYSGTWAAAAATDINGWQVSSSTAASFGQFTFEGTGFELRFSNNATTATWTMTLDGATNLTATNGSFWTGSLTTSSYGAGVTSFTASTGVLVTSASATTGNGISVSGLNYGTHTMKFTQTSGTGIVYLTAFDYIPLVYSSRSNIYMDLQNTLPIGGNALSDDRTLTPIKNALPATKAWGQAVGVASAPTNATTTMAPLADLSLSLKTLGGRVEISYSATVSNGTVGDGVQSQIYVDGIAAGTAKQVTSATANALGTLADTFSVELAPGPHKFEVWWSAVTAGTATAAGVLRNMLVSER